MSGKSASPLAKLFAGEPDVKQPIAFAIDHRGRVWVAEAYTYPIPAPEGQGKDRILASYETGGERAAYNDPVGVGDELPEMPLFLSNSLHVRVPLEPTYMATWDASPLELRIAVETGELPQGDEE